jgi:UDP-2,3-diacylglucosamine pyrophosphatase LpxH
MGRILFTADLHLTIKEADRYRWKIFNWLAKRAEHYGAEAICILGDLTDEKDHHSAALVNRLVTDLKFLAGIAPVHILMGNHDYVDPDEPFFGFLGDLQGIRFHSDPSEINLAGHRTLMLPHTQAWKSAWRGIDWKGLEFILLHQTIRKARVPNGATLDGIPSSIFRKRAPEARVIAGDVHVPQEVGGALYCGSPYPIRFGDDFSPRVLFWDGKAIKNLAIEAPKKLIVRIRRPEDLEGLDLGQGDQVKVILKIPRSAFSDWKDYREEIQRIAQEKSFLLCGIQMEERAGRVRLDEEGPGDREIADPGKIIARFSKAHRLDKETLRIGKDLLERAEGE